MRILLSKIKVIAIGIIGVRAKPRILHKMFSDEKTSKEMLAFLFTNDWTGKMETDLDRDYLSCDVINGFCVNDRVFRWIVDMGVNPKYLGERGRKLISEKDAILEKIYKTTKIPSDVLKYVVGDYIDYNDL